MLAIELDNAAHAAEFVRLNELWITEHFAIEDADRALAADPLQIITNGGHLLSLTDAGRVVGVCALFKESAERFQLARMAVAPGARGKGHGNTLVEAALAQATARGASSVVLFSNTRLAAAIALYRKYGFTTVSEGPHPRYARCNIVMERAL